MAPSTPELLEVGVVGRAHGLAGEVYVHLITDRTERLDRGSRLKSGDTWLTVSAAKRHQQRWLVTFDGVHDRAAAERLTSSRLYAEPIDDPDALWVHDLVGARVRTVDGADAGVCVGVVANPASDLLELDSGSLVPERFVVDATDGVVTIDPPAGLLDDDDRSSREGDPDQARRRDMNADRDGDGAG